MIYLRLVPTSFRPLYDRGHKSKQFSTPVAKNRCQRVWSVFTSTVPFHFPSFNFPRHHFFHVRSLLFLIYRRATDQYCTYHTGSVKMCTSWAQVLKLSKWLRIYCSHFFSCIFSNLTYETIQLLKLMRRLPICWFCQNPFELDPNLFIYIIECIIKENFCSVTILCIKLLATTCFFMKIKLHHTENEQALLETKLRKKSMKLKRYFHFLNRA